MINLKRFSPLYFGEGNYNSESIWSNCPREELSPQLPFIDDSISSHFKSASSPCPHRKSSCIGARGQKTIRTSYLRVETFAPDTRSRLIDLELTSPMGAIKSARQIKTHPVRLQAKFEGLKNEGGNLSPFW